MVRPMSALLAFWCAGLFVVGQGAHVPQLLVWGVGFVAFASLLFAMVAPDLRPRPRHVLSFMIGGALLALGVVAWVMHTPPWVPLCTLAGAGCYLGVVIAELLWSPRDRGTMAPADADPRRFYAPDLEPGSDEYRAARDEERMDRGLPVRPLA